MIQVAVEFEARAREETSSYERKLRQSAAEVRELTVQSKDQLRIELELERALDGAREELQRCKGALQESEDAAATMSRSLAEEVVVLRFELAEKNKRLEDQRQRRRRRRLRHKAKAALAADALVLQAKLNEAVADELAARPVVLAPAAQQEAPGSGTGSGGGVLSDTSNVANAEVAPAPLGDGKENQNEAPPAAAAAAAAAVQHHKV